MVPERFRAVKQAHVQSYPDLFRIWERSVEATHDFLAREDFEMLKGEVPGYFPLMEHLYVYAGDNGVPHGFVGVADGKIEMLFVSPEYIGKGIGSRLFDYAAGVLGAVCVDVNEQNLSGLAFYTRKGCRRVGRRELDSSGRPYPIIEMVVGQG